MTNHNSRSCRAQPCGIEGEDPAVVKTALDVLQYQRQRMRTRRRNEQFDREMEALDLEIEELQAQIAADSRPIRDIPEGYASEDS